MSKQKLCKDCWKPRDHNIPTISRCKACTYKRSAENKNQKNIYTLKRTPVKKIWKKRADRINEKGSEYKVFVEIWQERPKICANCGKPIKFFHSSCFAHILSKRDYPKLRYEKENIALVHWVFEVKNEETGQTYDCHKELDTKLSWKKLEIYDKFIKKTWQKG